MYTGESHVILLYRQVDSVALDSVYADAQDDLELQCKCMSYYITGQELMSNYLRLPFLLELTLISHNCTLTTAMGKIEQERTLMLRFFLPCSKSALLNFMFLKIVLTNTIVILGF